MQGNAAKVTRNAAFLTRGLTRVNRHTNQELLYRHYRQLVTREQAAKYWAITPANLVAISA